MVALTFFLGYSWQRYVSWPPRTYVFNLSEQLLQLGPVPRQRIELLHQVLQFGRTLHRQLVAVVSVAHVVQFLNAQTKQ